MNSVLGTHWLCVINKCKGRIKEGAELWSPCDYKNEVSLKTHEGCVQQRWGEGKTLNETNEVTLYLR